MLSDGSDYDRQGPSYLDGVQVKISEKFKPPRKVTLPVGFQHRLSNQCHIPEHSFNVEKHVLTSMAEWRKRRKDLKEARKERLQIEHEKEKKKKEEEEEEAAKEQNSEDSSRDETVDEHVSVSSSVSSDSPTPRHQEPPVVVPTSSSSTNTSLSILTPVPFSWSTDVKDETKEGHLSSFNISDFESDTASPFDNEELKTLNDMEELAHVLQPHAVKNKENEKDYSASVESRPALYSQFPIPRTYSNNTVNAKYHHYAVCDLNLSSNKSYQNMNGMSQYNGGIYSTVPRSYMNNQQTITNDIKPRLNSNLPTSNYKIFPNYLDGTVANREQFNYYHSNISTHTQAPYMNSPPIGVNTTSPSSYVPTRGISGYSENEQSLSNPVMSTGTKQSVTSASIGTTDRSYLQTKNRFPLPASDSIDLFKSHLNNFTQMSSVVPTIGGVRSSRSVPDLVEELGKELQKQKVEDGPTRKSSHTPPPRPSSMGTPGLENWSPWPELDSPAHSGGGPFNKNHVPESCAPSLSNSLNEPAKDIQQMAHRISEMGFPIERVARACQKLGVDDKKVVEFLLQVQALEEQGFPSTLAETALTLHGGDLKSAMTYLNLMSQFIDLGFPQDRISQALLLHNNNRDQALDFLVS